MECNPKMGRCSYDTSVEFGKPQLVSTDLLQLQYVRRVENYTCCARTVLGVVIKSFASTRHGDWHSYLAKTCQLY